MFFGAHAALAALIEIVVTLLVIIATTGAFGQVDRRASQLLLPYLAWVTFAALLNGAIAALN